MRGVNDVALDHHVLVDEIRRVAVVGDNTAHFRCRQIHLVNTFVRKELLRRLAIEQVQLVAGADNQFSVAALLQLTDNG
ncbi:hypothetical protein D3C72_429180 [compost metagenome]